MPGDRVVFRSCSTGEVRVTPPPDFIPIVRVHDGGARGGSGAPGAELTEPMRRLTVAGAAGTARHGLNCGAASPAADLPKLSLNADHLATLADRPPTPLGTTPPDRSGGAVGEQQAVGVDSPTPMRRHRVRVRARPHVPRPVARTVSPPAAMPSSNDPGHDGHTSVRPNAIALVRGDSGGDSSAFTDVVERRTVGPGPACQSRRPKGGSVGTVAPVRRSKRNRSQRVDSGGAVEGGAGQTQLSLGAHGWFVRPSDRSQRLRRRTSSGGSSPGPQLS